MRLPSPFEIKTKYLNPDPSWIRKQRTIAMRILKGEDKRLALIIGPCSIHDINSAIEYAKNLKNLSEQIEDRFFIIMRAFIEKPRTKLGWKGMLYDPDLDGTNDIRRGIEKSRELILEMIKLKLPIAMELLDPLIANYFDDLITWGLIGARTSASQPHRQLASGLDFPIGFKNDLSGDINIAIYGISASKIPHTHIGIDENGQISKVQTKGNPFSHLVLRGSDMGPNYYPENVQEAIRLMKSYHLPPRMIIDCSHGNCGKRPEKQLEVFSNLMDQVKTTPEIRGLMLESHLFSGKQPLSEDPSLLSYGISITDPCIGWEETQKLLLSTSMSFVQN